MGASGEEGTSTGGLISWESGEVRTTRGVGIWDIRSRKGGRWRRKNKTRKRTITLRQNTFKILSKCNERGNEDEEVGNKIWK